MVEYKENQVLIWKSWKVPQNHPQNLHNIENSLCIGHEGFEWRQEQDFNDEEEDEYVGQVDLPEVYEQGFNEWVLQQLSAGVLHHQA